jgi:glycosyltransferase involved in cell wall biosynthesis
MRIAVNTRLLIPGRLEGLGTFTHEVLQRMVKAHPEHEFIFIFDRQWDESFIYGPNVIPIKIGPQARHPILYHIWFEYSLPRIFKKMKPDIFLSPDGYLSLRSTLPQVAVIHDLNFEHHPEFFDAFHRWHYHQYFPKYAVKASRIATVSEFSKSDIVTHYHIPENKIDVIYNGVDQTYQSVSEKEKEAIRIKYSQGEEYFVFVGGLYPRKNLARIIQAFDLFKSRTGSKMKFLIAGKRYRESQDIFDMHSSLKHKNDIEFLGRIEPKSEIPKLLTAARSLVYVSLFEGFGLPIAEAMKCETAVITGNITAMPEIANGAALLCNPYQTKDIAKAMEQMMNNDLRNRCIERGKEVVKSYSWEKTADELWNSCIKCNQ